jgi:hypothetical protein
MEPLFENQILPNYILLVYFRKYILLNLIRPLVVRYPSVAVALLVAVSIAEATTPELRHPCWSPCTKSRKRHEGENFTRRREPLDARALNYTALASYLAGWLAG